MRCAQSRIVRHFFLAAALCLPILGASVASGQWEQVFKFLADDPVEDDGFGGNVGVSGNIVIVGAPPLGSNEGGAAYIFDASTGDKLRELTASSAVGFGVGVAVDGTIAIVGDPGDGHAGQWSGAAYIFDVTTGEQLHKLTADDASELDRLGMEVSISGNTAVASSSSGIDGAVYVFNVSTGEQLYKLAADDTATGDEFANSISISGDIVVVGAPGVSDAGCCWGAAYVFNATTGQQIHKLQSDDIAAEDWFGYSVSVSGNMAIIGATGDDDLGGYSGSAYLFNIPTGEQLRKLNADDGAAEDYFGHAVSISGNVAMIGAPQYFASGDNTGKAYFFDVQSGIQLQKIMADDGAAGDRFGEPVCVGGEYAIAGATGSGWEEAIPGSAYVFRALGAPCPADITEDGAVDVLDLLEVLGAWGPCEACPEDITGDGVVDVLDLLEVLGAWGPCL